MIELAVGMTVIANRDGLGRPYRAKIQCIYDGKAQLRPLQAPFTASTAKTGNYKKRLRWVRLDRLYLEDEAAPYGPVRTMKR